MKHGNEVQTDNIPTDIKRNRRWATYRLEPKDSGGFNKRPRNASMGLMSWSNPEEWLTYEEALTTLRGRDNCDGIGYFLGCGIWGIDIDGCVSEGVISPEALEIIEGLNSYTELSPSGTGVHILFRVDDYSLKGKRRRNDERGLELYDGEDSPRFFTVTGKPLEGYGNIREASKEVAAFYNDYMATDEKKPASIPVVTEPVNAEDTKLIEWMSDLYKGAGDLWRGDYSAYSRPVKDRNGNVTGYTGDHSRADLALCTYLIAVCHGDTARADQLFRQSGLYRPKWDEMHGAATYGDTTLNKALESYDPKKAPNYEAWAFGCDGVLESAYQSFKEKHTANKATESRITGENTQTPISTPKNGDNAAQGITEGFTSVSDYMAETLDRDLSIYATGKGVTTGWSNLDRQITSLYPGLYVLGAKPGAGKTTWAWQLAEHLAESGRKVIYISLEMTKLELVSKSLARRAFVASDDIHSPSTMQVRTGTTNEYVKQAREDFSKVGKNLYVMEGDFYTNIETIVNRLMGVMDTLTIEGGGLRPAVFVDYLQIIQSGDSRINTQDRARVEHVAHELKNLQKQYGLIMFVISSYSRDAYQGKTKLDSSKESGGIEYTADAVLGLDLACLHEPKPEGKTWEQVIDEEDRKNPKRIMLTCVKSRLFPGRMKNAFNFHWQHDLMTECRIQLEEQPETEQKAARRV